METFVFAELTKLRSVSPDPFIIRHFRDRSGKEIDFVLERYDGRIVGIEVKASASPTAKDAAALRWLRDALGDQFACGIVLHLGQHTVSFGDRILALPASALWGHAQLPTRSRRPWPTASRPSRWRPSSER